MDKVIRTNSVKSPYFSATCYMINTIKHLTYVLGCSQGDINNVLKDIDKYYYKHTKEKIKYGRFQTDKQGNIKYRDLTSSIFPLKSFQLKINDRILKKISLPEFAYGSVKNHNNILNAKFHSNSKYFLSIDLKKYFTYVSCQQVNKMFIQNNFSHDVARILTRLTTFEGCLPQGTPTSPAISNLVFVNTGQALRQLAEIHHIKFTTFLDDLTFSSSENFKPLLPEIISLVTSGGFFINHNKVAYKSNKAEVTGLNVCKGKLYLVDEMNERAQGNSLYKGYLKAIADCNRS